jgi:predicted secreted protein
MASNAFSGVGATFGVGDGTSNESFTAVAEVRSISGFNMARNTIEVTNLDSPNGYREFIAGFRDPGEITIEFNFTLDGYDGLKAKYDEDVTANYNIVLPDTGATEFVFTAWCTGLSGPNVTAENAVTGSVTLKVTSDLTINS